MPHLELAYYRPSRRKVVFFFAPVLAATSEVLRSIVLCDAAEFLTSPGDSTRVAVPSGPQLSGQKKLSTSTRQNPTASVMGEVTTDLECMDIAQDTHIDHPSNIFPEITETIVDISIRSALHYLQYKEILMAADNILHSIPSELHTACLTFGQLQSLREHARTYITVQDILSSQIHHIRTEANPTADGHPMLAKPRQSLKDLETDLNVWVGNVISYLTTDHFIPIFTENTNFNIFDNFIFKTVLPQTTIPTNSKNKRRRQSPQQNSDDSAEITTDNNPPSNTHQFPKLTQKQRKTIKKNTPSKTIVNKKPNLATQTNPKTSANVTPNPATFSNPNVRPIMIMKPNDIHSFMKKINTDLKTKITCKLTTQYLKLEPETETLHTTITKYLDNTNVPYYLITPKNLRPLKAVLRGLPINTDLDTIKHELTELHFQVINIYQLKKRDQARTPMPLFQIQLAPTENIEEIWTLDNLLFTKITVEKYNNKGGISQCHRCQLFGHSSINCKLPIKCVKCAGQHLTKDCSITNHTETPVCANCQGSHPASYRGCPKFPKLNSSTNKQQANPVTFTSNYAKPNISYSSITSNNSKNITTDTPSLLTTLKDAVFDSEILLLLQVIKNVLPEIKKATNPYDKMYALIKAASEVFEQAAI
ncbi:nucleic-acid-binding protein from transposon X-element [Caerostris darwini]|uniref:Nucleic-acid-binding protein from transposon X-element n=1 Tax=Caerostris darwini TaxID=1538125 RepID=A0AAV4M4G4_9ARAC|nr:nucleic-acid-binding protein from transposon X-element [Caerostris darwini]